MKTYGDPEEQKRLRDLFFGRAEDEKRNPEQSLRNLYEKEATKGEKEGQDPAKRRK